MSGRKRKYALDQRGGFRNGPEQQIGFDRVRIDIRSNAPAGDQRSDFGGKQKRPVRAGIIERLDSQAVASKENARVPRAVPLCAGGTRIPYGEGKHAAKFADTLLAPFFIGMDDNFGVGVRAEFVPEAFEALAQLPEIIDFTVEDNSNIADFVENGLVAAGKIDDAEAAHPQRRGRRDQESVFVRPSMPDRLHHPARKGFAYFGAFNSDDTADAAHSALLYRERGRSSTLTCYRLCAAGKCDPAFMLSGAAAASEARGATPERDRAAGNFDAEQISDGGSFRGSSDGLESLKPGL